MELRPSAPSRPPNPALPYREDCWSEGETEVLINAWGDRYVEVNRGSLRQKQWQEVADAVNSRPCDARRPPRTDVQCKNRVDTLKKKYKSERAKMAADGSSSLRSPWKFFDQMDYLIGSSLPPAMAAKKSSSSSLPHPPPLMPNSSPPMALPLPPNRKQPFPLPTASAVRVDPPRRNYSDDYGSDPSSESEARDRSGRRVRRKREAESRGSGDDGIRELSRAIARLAEIYESVEEEKQRHMMELEKQRMEFAKELEFQRMQMFADSQVQLVKMNKRSRRGGGGGGGGGSGDGGENGSAALLPFLLQPVLL
ncbi:putative trihelix transcription factor ASIL2 [Iris pallida]|uniref:Trihelix transcription factor ASIL2 n=1 Tax=Iris pallida TaxID=29817 RepID=A0AAX6F5M8_IRIPA|nr:putative trihelix transcription factor ASIL2 [Iris pallida]KAJ6826499.1 putative trihelix transcription factor ASIL2 [Iris pallida]